MDQQFTDTLNNNAALNIMAHRAIFLSIIEDNPAKLDWSMMCVEAFSPGDGVGTLPGSEYPKPLRVGARQAPTGLAYTPSGIIYLGYSLFFSRV